MTSDTHPKEAAASCEIGGKTVRVGGIAKGAGMIDPNMADDAQLRHHGRRHRKGGPAKGAAGQRGTIFQTASRWMGT